MQITIDVPDALAIPLSAGGLDPSRAFLETLAAEAYRTDTLSEGELRKILGYETPMQFHELLKRHGVHIHYSVQDYEQDKATLRRLCHSVAA